MTFPILTYHRIPTKSGGQPTFYDVDAASLGLQLELLKAKGVSAGPLDEGLAERCGCALTFDDGTVDHFDTVPAILAAAGVRATFFVPTAKLGRDGYLTTSQVRELSAAGHVIASHSHHHRLMHRMSADEATEQLRQSRAILEDITGQPVRVFAPPGGYLSSTVSTAALELEFQVVRTMQWGLNQRLRKSALQCIPMNRHFDLELLDAILRGRRLLTLRLAYLVKQGVKRFLPLNAYEMLRNSFRANLL